MNAHPRELRRVLPRVVCFVTFSGCPGLTRSFLDVAPNQASQDLGGRGVLLRAQALEQRFLAWVDENREPGGAVFESHVIPSWRQNAVAVIIIKRVSA